MQTCHYVIGGLTAQLEMPLLGAVHWRLNAIPCLMVTMASGGTEVSVGTHGSISTLSFVPKIAYLNLRAIAGMQIDCFVQLLEGGR